MALVALFTVCVCVWVRVCHAGCYLFGVVVLNEKLQSLICLLCAVLFSPGVLFVYPALNLLLVIQRTMYHVMSFELLWLNQEPTNDHTGQPSKRENRRPTQRNAQI